jgi:hypothetical protein
MPCRCRHPRSSAGSDLAADDSKNPGLDRSRRRGGGAGSSLTAGAVAVPGHQQRLADLKAHRATVAAAGQRQLGHGSEASNTDERLPRTGLHSPARAANAERIANDRVAPAETPQHGRLLRPSRFVAWAPSRPSPVQPFELPFRSVTRRWVPRSARRGGPSYRIASLSASIATPSRCAPGPAVMIRPLAFHGWGR